MLGIGLGGFAKGLESGYEMGEKIVGTMKASREKRAVGDALKQGETDYQAAVAKGEAQPNDPNGILRYAYPQIVKAYQETGDVEGIQKASDWIKSDQAKQGTSLFASGMVKGQSGDIGGALNDFLAAGKVQGFGNYEVGEPEEMDGGGIRVSIKDRASGKSTVQEFKTPDDVLRFGATHFNPPAQFEQWKDSQKAESEYKRDVAKSGDEERAKLTAKTEDATVRRNLGISGDKDTVGARKQAVEELKGSADYEDADSGMRDEMIEERATKILGGQSATGLGVRPKRVIVDTKTGKLVETKE